MLCAAAMVAAPAAMQAQGGMTKKTTFGIMGGLNLAKLDGDDVPSDAENRVGFLIGGFMTYPLAQMFSLQTELYYTQKGVKFAVSDPDLGDFELQLKPNYFEIPVLGRLDFSNSTGDMGFHVLGGPAFAFKAGCRVSVESGSDEASSDCDDDDSANEVKSFDWGVMFGGGLDFKMMERTLTLGVRYNLGMTDLREEGDAKHRVLSFILGVGF
jgi:hypothetical protein